jgi:hypothetical protein
MLEGLLRVRHACAQQRREPSTTHQSHVRIIHVHFLL